MSQRIEAAHAWIVAEIDGTVAGYAYGSPFGSRAAYRWTCEVSVYLAESARGRGLGKALYTELLERLRSQGLHVAVSGIALPNDASVALHTSLGFRLVGVYERVGFKHGTWHDLARYQLRLQDGTPN